MSYWLDLSFLTGRINTIHEIWLDFEKRLKDVVGSSVSFCELHLFCCFTKISLETLILWNHTNELLWWFSFLFNLPQLPFPFFTLTLFWFFSHFIPLIILQYNNWSVPFPQPPLVYNLEREVICIFPTPSIVCGILHQIFVPWKEVSHDTSLLKNLKVV